MKDYQQFCGVAKALDVLGGRWTLLLVRDLMLGPRRFSDLQAAHPGLTPNLLTDRLRLLQAHGLVAQQRLPPPAASAVYALTEDGAALEEVVLALGRFGQRYLTHPSPGERTDIRWFALSLRRRFRGSGAPFRVQLLHGVAPEVVPIHLWFDGARLHTRDGQMPADATLQAAQVPQVLLGVVPLSQAVVTGELGTIQRLLAGLQPSSGGGV